ncbi:MAG: cyclic nucleotide-binding domain-containing protein [Sedimenticolaceae bacterium]
METIARTAAWESVPAGAAVMRKSDPGDRFYVLESGAMRMTRGGRHLRDFDAVIEGFGEIALPRDVPRTATVTALRNSVLLVLSHQAFLGAVTGHSVVAAEASRMAEARM